MLKKQLTNLIESDNIYKLSAEKRKDVEKSIEKVLKNFQKSLDKQESVWYTLQAVYEWELQERAKRVKKKRR